MLDFLPVDEPKAAWDIHDVNSPLASSVPTGAEFFERLIEALTDEGLPTTQMQIADQLGVSQASVSKWKHSQAYPSKAVAARAAKLCKVSLAWLFFGIGAKKGADVDELVWALMSAFEKLPDSERRELVAFAKFKAAQSAPERAADDTLENDWH